MGLKCMRIKYGLDVDVATQPLANLILLYFNHHFDSFFDHIAYSLSPIVIF